MNQKEVYNIIEKFTGQANILTLPRIFIELTNSIATSLLLSQLIYWSSRSKDDGWVYKSYAEWEQEIGLSKYKVKKATDQLKGLKLLKTKLKKVNGVPTLHYKLDSEEISLWIVKKFNNGKSNNLTILNTETTTAITDKEDSCPNGHEVAAPPNQDHEEILKHWNQIFKDIRAVSKHSSINVKGTRFMKDGKYQYKSITETLQEAEDKGYTSDQIKTAITNYYHISLNNDFYRNWMTLGNFVYAGVVNGTGFVKFLSNNNIDPFNGIREVFKPVTVDYNEHSIFDKTNYTYYGISTNKLTDEKDMRETIGDIRTYIRMKRFTYGCLNWIEIVIASLLYTRKNNPQLELINEMLEWWKKLKVLGKK